MNIGAQIYKSFSDYFAAFLESKGFKNLDKIVDVIHRDIQMRHAIAMFVIIAKKSKKSKVRWGEARID